MNYQTKKTDKTQKISSEKLVLFLFKVFMNGLLAA